MEIQKAKTLLKAIRKQQAVIDFWRFCIYFDEPFFSKRIFLKDIADAFMQIHNGEIKSLSVSLSPRAGKSYITSLFCAWTLGNKPTESVMRNTCTATLYDKFSYDVRTIVKSTLFKEVFPHVELSEDKQNLDGWRLKTSKQVAYFGAGVGGTIIGFGASALAITDDLYKSMEDALSETINDKVHSWKQAAHDSRLEKNCPTIDIGTRWSKKDIIGNNIEKNRYDKIIVVPAMIDEKSFCEDVKSTEEYIKIRSEIDPIIWNAEYMQEPIEAKGSLFHPNELNYFNIEDKLNYESSVCYIDVADEGSDYMAAIVGRNIKEKIYITDIAFSKKNTDETIPLCVELIKRNNCSYARVESNSMGAMFARNMQKELTTCRVLTAHATTNKHTRIIMDAGFIKKYFYFIDRKNQNHMYLDFITQLSSYTKEGKSKHDDAPDAASGLAIFIRALFKNYYY